MSSRSRFLLVVVILLAACGNGSQLASTTPPGTSPATTTRAPSQTVDVFFGIDGSADCSAVQSFQRPVSPNEDPITVAFDALLAGPLESETHATSWFSDATAGSVRSIAQSEGVLTVDLDDLSAIIPNASSSCGSAAFLAQLQATAFQFDEVAEVTFLFEGSCERLFQFLQMECTPAARSD